VNAVEMGKLLAFAASYDNRKVGDAEVIAWLEAIGDLPFADARSAVARHYGETTDRLMPAHVRQRVKAMRSDRLAREILPAPAAELTDNPRRYRDRLAALIHGIADGMQVSKAIAPAGPSGIPDSYREAKARLGKAAPKLTPQEIAAQQAAESRAEREAADRKEAS
jgi:hypothetical protein